MHRKRALRVLSPLTEQQLSNVSPESSVLFLSGITAAGKDSILSLAIQAAKKKGILIRPIAKISDRDIRRREAQHFHHVSADKFVSMLKAHEILLPYRWFGRRYGFSVADFLGATAIPGTVVLQMTDLRKVPQATAAFRAFGIRTAALFVTAPPLQLALRTLRRSLPAADCAKRILAAWIEFATSNVRATFRSEYHRIHNKDGNVIDSADRVMHIVSILQKKPNRADDTCTEPTCPSRNESP